MWIYIFIFFLAWMMFLIGNYFYGKLKFLYYSFSYLGIFIVSLFAGLRSYDIGTDIQVYGNNIFYSTRLDSISDAINLNARWANRGYVYFNWLISRFTDNPHIYYGILTFVFTAIFFQFVLNQKKSLYLPFTMFLFLFILWPVHLNILRQGLSIVLTAVVLDCFLKEKNMTGIVTAIVAFYIHDSSIVISLMYFVILVLFSKIIVSKKFNISVVTVSILIFSVLIIPYILGKFPSLITLFASKYYYIVNAINWSSFSLYRSMLFLIPILPFYGSVKRSDSLIIRGTYLLCLINVVFNGFASANYVLFGRLSYYFYVPFILFISENIYLIKRPLKRYLYYIIYMSYSVFFFINMYALGNYGNLFPYKIG